MTPAYKILYDYSLQLTGNKRQSRKIVNYVILEGARILAEAGDADKAHQFMITKMRSLSYDYTRRRDLRQRPYKRIWCAMRYFGNLSY